MLENEIRILANDIHKSHNIQDLLLLEEKYKDLNTPYKAYIFGVSYLIKGDKSKALYWFLDAVKNIIIKKPENEYLNSIYHNDAIGSSLFYIAVHFNEIIFKKDFKYNLVVNAYFYLSYSIKNIGINAYESYLNRAKLIEKYQNDRILFSPRFLDNHNYPEVFILSDYYFSSKGYEKYGYSELADENLRKSNQIHCILDDMVIGGKDADEYSLDEISKLGKLRHEHIFAGKYEWFLDGAFCFDIEEEIDFNFKK